MPDLVFTPLATLGGDWGYANDVNASGIVVGVSAGPAGGNLTVWIEGTPHLVGHPDDYAGELIDINDEGQAIGYAWAAGGIPQGVAWKDGLLSVLPGVPIAQTDIGEVTGATYAGVLYTWYRGQHAILPHPYGQYSPQSQCLPTGMANDGVVVADCWTARGSRAYAWSSGTWQQLEVPFDTQELYLGEVWTSTWSRLNSSVNAVGSVAGRFSALWQDGTSRRGVVLWREGRIVAMAEGPLATSIIGFNNRDQVLLLSELVSPAGGIAIWDGRSVVDLQLPWVRPEDINDLGQVVGCRGAGNEGVVWDGGTVVSLGPGTCAWGLNNVGMAVGGWQAPSGSWQPALWQARRLATPDEETALLSATIEQLAQRGNARSRPRTLSHRPCRSGGQCTRSRQPHSRDEPPDRAGQPGRGAGPDRTTHSH